MRFPKFDFGGKQKPHWPMNDRLAGLDLLRLFAALLVVAYHFLYRGSLGSEYTNVQFGLNDTLLRYGYYGINLFFLISGFVILWTAESKPWHRFLVARFARLWPAFIACVTITAGAALLYSKAPFQVGLDQWLANLTFVAPAFGQPFMDGVYWTIVLELVFYGWVALALMIKVLPKYLFLFHSCCMCRGTPRNLDSQRSSFVG